VRDESGFYYLQSRYYDPKIGRFISADGLIELGLTGSLNLFEYCINDPVQYNDPKGYMQVKGIDACGGGNNVNQQWVKSVSDNKSVQSTNTGAAAPYVYISSSNGDRSTNPNCYSYALGYYNASYNPGDFSTPFIQLSVYAVANAVESDLKNLGRGCRRIDSFNSPIRDTEYRIALRVSDPEGALFWDYHFMVQTDTGGWAEKHGPGGSTVYHSSGNPTTLSWDCDPYVGFYNSDIVYFAITY